MPFEVQARTDFPANTPFRAKLKSLEHRVIPYADKKTGEQKTFERLKWIFEVTQDGDFFGKTVQAEIEPKLEISPYNVFFNWASQLLGRDLLQGELVSEEDLVGLPCLITVRYEEDRKDPTKVWPRVEDVISVGDNFDEPPF